MNMDKPSVEELEGAESRLNRAFIMAAVAVVLSLATGVWWQTATDRGAAWTVFIVTRLFLLAAYVWFALAIGRVAKYLVPSPRKYVAWVLAAPFLALIPIPIVSTVIALSPLSLKFFFSRQLQNEIKERVLAD